MSEIADEINRLHRRVGTRQVESGEARTVLLRRTYDAEIADVWDAVTSPNASRAGSCRSAANSRSAAATSWRATPHGEILECVEPERLRVSWLYGPDPGFSEVEVRLTPEDGERTVLELEHVAVVPDEFWDQFGPGAVGVGWDLGLYGLRLHLAGGGLSKEEAATWHTTPEGSAFITGSGEAWGEAYAASGADAETAARTTAATIAFYTGTEA